MKNLLVHNKDLIESVLVHRDTTPLYRGVRSRLAASGDPFIVTRLNPRSAVNTDSSYMHMIDRHPDNQDWPKRSMSHICTTSAASASEYGDLHVVIPLVDYTVGVVGTFDFWEAMNGPELNHILQQLDVFANNPGAYLPWEEVHKHADKYDEEYRAKHGDVEVTLPSRWVRNRRYKHPETMSDLMYIAQDLFRYEPYDSMLGAHRDMYKVVYEEGTTINGVTEVWFEGPALYVPYSTYLQFEGDSSMLESLMNSPIQTVTVGK